MLAVLRPTTAKAASETPIEPRDDGSLFIGKSAADVDTYTLTQNGPLGDLHVLRLEAMVDAKLPGNGPGLAGKRRHNRLGQRELKRLYLIRLSWRGAEDECHTHAACKHPGPPPCEQRLATNRAEGALYGIE